MPDSTHPDSGLPAERPNCYKCRYFAVSWDPRLPYMCSLMGFKSRVLPCIEVLRVDGLPCQGFFAKSTVPGSAQRASLAGCTVKISGLSPALASAAELPELGRLPFARRPDSGS